ncbi:MAG: efflux RND transporter periplasmic adaptor subunit, partial [Fimbriimonadales bacterium]|nr:efflux RND transporter periplasmic adaptor subunit [Fimbriimonadales bacterium]
KRGDITLDVTESGAIEPVRTVEIKSRVSGRLAALYVDEGDRITKEQLLARIDPREVQQQVEQGSAQVESAKASTERARIALEIQAKEARLQLRQAELRVEQLERELKAQPVITQAAIRAAETAYQNAQENLRLLQQVKHPQERLEAENAVRDAEARLQEAQRNYERTRTLLEKGYVSRQQLDAAQTALTLAQSQLQSARQRQQQLAEQQRIELETAKATLESARAELERARASAVQDEIKRKAYEAALTELETARNRLREIEMSQLELKQAQAAEKQAVSQLRNWLIQLAETDVRSPIDGVVIRRYREVGELVMSGTMGFGEGTPIMQVADLSQMRVRLNLNELDVAKVRVGMPVEVKVDALPERTFKGVVKQIAPAAQQSSGGNAPLSTALGVVKFAVEVYLSTFQGGGDLRPGMTARCRILTATRKNTLILPLEALGKEGDRYYVLKLNPNARDAQGKPKREKVFVKIGLRNASHAEILEGLQEGDQVAKPPFAGPARRQFEIREGREEEREQ